MKLRRESPNAVRAGGLMEEEMDSPRIPKIGQEVYFVPYPRRGLPRMVKVTSVGRKYFDAVGVKVHLTDWREKTEYACGKAWETKEAYEAHILTQEKWSKFRCAIGSEYQLPAGITESSIQQAAELLGITL